MPRFLNLAGREVSVFGAVESLAIREASTRQLVKTRVAVEKVPFHENRRDFGDRKCPPKQRSSIVRLPIAKFFRAFSAE